MDVGAQPVARIRGLELSPRAFQRLAFANAAMLVLIVATGATVRLTGSGLGCEHWPGCAPGQFIPKKGYHSAVEFGNRVVAFFTVVTTLLLALSATFMRALPRREKVLSWAVFGGTLAQAPLGALTVYFHLNPYLVITHLLLSLAVIGVAVLVALDGERAPLPVVARSLGVALLAAVTFLVVTGT